MFELRSTIGGEEKVPFEFEGETMWGSPSSTLAAALLVNGIDTFRLAPADGSPRGPYCMMGACFECLVQIEGAGNRQACLTLLVTGMRVSRSRNIKP